jgi:hypothetical protein
MNLTDKFASLATLGRDLAQQKSDTLINDAEQRLQAIADTLAKRIERSVMTAAVIICAGLLALSGVLWFR